MKRLIAFVLIVGMTLALILPIITDGSTTYTGLNLLLGQVDGKVSGEFSVTLILMLIFLASTAYVLAAKKTATFVPSFLLLLALGSYWLTVFDLIYSPRAEFLLEPKAVTPGFGAYVIAALALIAFFVTLLHAFAMQRVTEKQRLAEIYAKSSLPSNYRERTITEIIKRDIKQHWLAYLFIVPALIYYAVWCYGPMYGILIGFNDFSPKKGIIGSTWVGLKQFRDFFRSPYAFRVIRNTVVLNFWNLIYGFPAPIILALLLNEMRGQKYKRTVQTITYMPHFISIVVICGILLDFTASDGVFSAIIKMFGGQPANFLGDAKYFRTVYVASGIWQHLGWDTIIFLSALSGIDQEQYEAATIDGAGKLKQVWHVTLPGILPVISILLILRIGSMMSVGFEKIILLYGPLTYETGDVISSFIYRKGMLEANYSFSTAVGLFNSVINFALVIFANAASRKLTETSLW